MIADRSAFVRTSLVGLLLAFGGGLPTIATAQRCTEPGFRVELIAAHPEIEHPSVVTCDEHGNLFVGEDPMDMRGPTTEEFDRVLKLEFAPDGSIAKKTVFCDRLSAVFGLIWHDDALYVMHAPHYTRFRDRDGDGVAEERTELADGFGPPAGVFGFNDHIVTGIRRGLDGRVYVSIGDKGVPSAVGADGSRVTLEGGGVLRMTIDGRELEVFSSGTRNHLDVAMDSLDRIFTYDNTDDGLGWWTRFTHHVPTGYYGYPFDYLNRPERHLPRISEHGGGSPVGAACYRGAIWPERYRDAAFCCEWGKGKVQLFRTTPAGATFTAEMTDFLVPEPNSDFRPQDCCFSRDGRHLYVADWNFGGWVQDKPVGRLYRITYVGEDAAAATLDPAALATASLEQAAEALADPNYDVRRAAQDRLATDSAALPLLLARLRNDSEGGVSDRAAVHALWSAASLCESPTSDESIGAEALAVVVEATMHRSAAVRAQAARALGSLAARRVPEVVTVTEREYRDRGDASRPTAVVKIHPVILGALRLMTSDDDPEVRLQAVVAIGRMADPIGMAELISACDDFDPTVRFTVRQAIRSIDDWGRTLPAVRSAAPEIARELLAAATGTYDAGAVAVLATLAERPGDDSLRAEAIRAIAETARRADRYEQGWWGTRPAAGPPARRPQHDWEGTPVALGAIRNALVDPAIEVRAAAIGTLRELDDPESLAQVRRSLEDAAPEIRLAAIDVVALRKDIDAIDPLGAIVESSTASDVERRRAIDALRAVGDERAARRLTGILGRETAAPEALVAALGAVGEMRHVPARSVVARRTHHEAAEVRAAALVALARIDGLDASERLVGALQDERPEVRNAALDSLGEIRAIDAVPAMISAFAEISTRTAAGRALARIADRRALDVYLQMLVDRSPELRQESATALAGLKDSIVDDLRLRSDEGALTSAMRVELSALFARPEPIRRWMILGAWSQELGVPEIDPNAPLDFDAPVRIGDREFRWREIATDHPLGRFSPAQTFDETSNVWALAVAIIDRQQAGKVRWQLGSDDQAVVSINGRVVYEFLGDRGWGADQGSGEAELIEGRNVILFRTGNSSGPWEFGMAIGGTDPQFAFLEVDPSSVVGLAAYRERGLTGDGDVLRGAELFFAAEGIGCAKCHAVGKQGSADIGPNLLGVGAKYPRDELIRSILEPSNRIFSGYEMTVVETDSGETIQGVVRSETAESLVIGDAKGELITIPIESIVARERSEQSAMPSGLEKGMTPDDFADLIAYLESLKQDAP